VYTCFSARAHAFLYFRLSIKQQCIALYIIRLLLKQTEQVSLAATFAAHNRSHICFTVLGCIVL